MYQLGAARDSELSPDGQVLLLSGLKGGGNVDQGTTVLTCVTRQLDGHGVFVPKVKPLQIHPCRSVQLVSTAAWPRLHLLDYTFTLLAVADVNTGGILSRLALGDDGLPLGKPDQEDLNRAGMDTIEMMRNQGRVVSGA